MGILLHQPFADTSATSNSSHFHRMQPPLGQASLALFLSLASWHLLPLTIPRLFLPLLCRLFFQGSLTPCDPAASIISGACLPLSSHTDPS